jgi:hypothetical protein
MKKSTRWVATLSAFVLGSAAVLALSTELPGVDTRIRDARANPPIDLAEVAGVLLPALAHEAGGALAECAQAGGYEFACKINGWAGNEMNGRYTCPLDPWDGDSGYNEIIIARSDGGSFEWQAMNPVAAIVVQWSAAAKAFRYEPGATRGTRVQDPGSGQPGAITHVTFCWDRD